MFDLWCQNTGVNFQLGKSGFFNDVLVFKYISCNKCFTPIMFLKSVSIWIPAPYPSVSITRDITSVELQGLQ